MHKPERCISDFKIDFVDSEELFRKLCHRILGNDIPDLQFKIFRDNIERKTWIMLKQAKSYIVEDYVETEWKDMITEYYIHTMYTVQPTVLRVHLFNNRKDDKEDAKSYLGCFTLRKIDNPDMVLSFIYPNWNVLSLEKCNFENSYLITAKKTIHIFADEIEITTTPYFVQDGSVTCCAHATILMMSKLLNLEFGYKKIRIPEISQSYLHREKEYPNKGLIPEQIMEVLTNNGVYIRPILVRNRKLTNDKKLDIRDRIKAHLRSGLPVLMLIDKHAVLIVGFRESDDMDGILFYDDSGVLIHNINENAYVNNDDEYDNFIYSCSWDYIFNYVETRHNENVTFLLPFHEKIFANYDDVSSRCLILENNINSKDLNSIKLQNKRFFIMDNVKCKSFINKHVIGFEIEDVKSAVDELLCANQPHYLWCFEFEYKSRLFILFANSTYNIHDKQNNIFINRDCIPFMVDDHFHTIDKIKLIDIDSDNIPLYSKRLRREEEFVDEHILVKERAGAKLANQDVGRPEYALEKRPVMESNTEDKKKRKKKKKKK